MKTTAASSRKTEWRSLRQLWMCVIVACLVLLHGAWMLYSLKGQQPQSPERQGALLVAGVYGLLLPSFAYSAHQAWRQRKS